MKNVQSVERISDILRSIAAHQDGAGVTEIAAQIDLPISTVSRFLLALESVDFVERVSASSGFRIGPGIFDLATQADLPQHLVNVARPYLAGLAQAIHEAVTLTILDQDQVYCIDQIPSHYNLQLQDWIGQYFPLHTSADGKIYLASMSEAHLTRYLATPLAPITPNSITDPAQLQQQLDKVRQAGYAYTQDEYEIGLVALASPIRASNGQVIAAVGLGAPTFRFPAEPNRDEIIQRLIETGKQISAQLQR